jgi:transketolase
VEVTTGPLGQGIANAVGMAMAARRTRGLLDTEAARGSSIFDHHIYCLASDGDIEEGVSSEASSLAATQRLDNLTLIYDSNRISIEDDTNIALTEDTAARYAAYGWHVQTVDWTHGDAHHYQENVAALQDALETAKAVTDRPSFICLHTIIGWPAPHLQGTGKAHGAALGDEEVADTKKVLGFDPDKTFEVADEVIEHTRKLVDRGVEAEQEWQQAYDSWAADNPDGKASGAAGEERAQPRMGGRTAELVSRSQGNSHPRSFGESAERYRPQDARTVGRFSRPRRIQPHHS